MKTTKNSNPVRVICYALVMTGILYLFAMDIYRTVWYRYPNELRELVNIKTAATFAQGENPFSVDSLDLPNSMLFYVYSFLAPLLGGFLIRLTGLDASLAMYLLHFLYSSVGIWLIALIVRKHTRSWLLLLLSVYLAHSLFWRYTNVTAFPDALGVLALIAMMYLIELHDGKKYTLPLLVLLSVLLFYTKEYFVIAGASVALFYFFTDRRKMRKYLLFTVISGIVSLAIVDRVFPLYFTETVVYLSPYLDSGLVESLKYSFGQFIDILIRFPTLFFFAIAAIVYRMLTAMKDTGSVPSAVKTILGKATRSFPAIHAAIAFLALIYLGCNKGTYLWYHLQLLMPAVLPLGIIAMDRAVRLLNAFFAENKIRSSDAWLWLSALCVLCASLLLTTSNDTPLFSPRERRKWDDTYRLVAAFPQDSVLLPSYLAYPRLEDGGFQYDWGHNEYISQEAYGRWKKSAVEQKLFPFGEKVYTAFKKQEELILERIRNREYALIVNPVNLSHNVVLGNNERFAETLAAHYVQSDAWPMQSLYTGPQKWDTCFLVPRAP